MRSIKNSVIIGLLFMTILILLSFYYNFSSFKNIGKQYDNSMQRNEKLAMLLKVKEDEYKGFMQYLRKRENRYYKAYITNKDIINH